LQFLDFRGLALGQHLGEDGIHADLFRDRIGSFLVIARDHRDLESHLVQIGNRLD